MEHDDTASTAHINHMNLTHTQTAPIYGVIAHYYLGTKNPPSMTPVLQALAAIEATAKIAEDGRSFFANLGDIVQHTNIDASTVARTLALLEEQEVLVRERRPFKPSVFKITWEMTLLGDEGADCLHAAQNDIYNH